MNKGSYRSQFSFNINFYEISLENFIQWAIDELYKVSGMIFIKVNY